MIYSKITILGAGLIGGAIGIDLKIKGVANEVCCWGRNLERLQLAFNKKACDKITCDLDEALENSEIIILATPPEIIKKQIYEIKPYLKEGTLVMDVGSVKASIVETASKADIRETGAEFLGCHPIAGSEKVGVQNAYAGLFVDAPCIITPDSNNTNENIEKGKKFWQDLGAHIIILDPDEHDLIIGFTSHLPHMISSVFVNSYSEKLKDQELVKNIIGPSFMDLTRIAASAPNMWKQIFLENRKNILTGIETFEDKLNKFKQLLYEKDADKLEEYLTQAKNNKKKI